MEHVIKNQTLAKDEFINYINERFENKLEVKYSVLKKEITEALSKCFDAGVRWSQDNIIDVPEKNIDPNDPYYTKTDKEILDCLVEEMKNAGCTTVKLYRYARDNDGDWFECDLREYFDERHWGDNCLNSKYTKDEENYCANYGTTVELLWDHVVNREIWYNPSVNPNTNGVEYDESDMGSGHTLDIVFEINEDGTYGFDEEWGYW